MFWTGIGPLVAWWRRRLRRQTWTVLAYHRVGLRREDCGPDIVDPVRFQKQIRYLRKRYELVTVGVALERIARGEHSARPLLSVTFDDGYLDNVTEALPVLKNEDCPATLYITVQAVRDGLPPWPHRLATDLLNLTRNPHRHMSRASGVPHPILSDFLQEAEKRHRTPAKRISKFLQRVKTLPDFERHRICTQASELAGTQDTEPAKMMRIEELLEWSRAGMEVGSHTISHPILSRLSATERGRELRESRAILERWVETPIRNLAFPNGKPGDWDNATLADVQAAGYTSAMTTLEGVNGGDSNPFCLKRICVGNDDVEVLAIRVSGLFASLRETLRAAFRPRHRSHHPNGAAHTGVMQSANKKPVRIAFIGGRGVGAAYSGIETYYEEIGSRLASAGHRVLVYSRSHFSGQNRFYKGMEVVRLPTIRTKHLETVIHTILSTIDVCFRRIDIVQYHALGSSPFSWIPRLTGKRTIVSVRGLDWQRAKWGFFARNYLRFCESASLSCPNATVVVSKTLRRHFRDRFGREVKYIPNGVRRRETPPPDQIRRWGLGRRNFLLYAGRLSPEKGLETLIQAHRPVSAECRLVIAGGSSYSEKYMEQLRRQAGPDVIFTGFLTGPILDELYGNALAFVLPSQMEGLSVALLEAMACALPVITSDIPENRELVDECGGYLFRLDDVSSLSEAIRIILSDRIAASRIGEMSRSKVSALFDWDAIARETMHIYQDVIDGGTSATNHFDDRDRAS
jgi:glycosyltransferase involved in cell wall biosynthesis/peptidoglycan/xylan/chitin deacetylase (PgdA/CDA1 family)